MATSAVSWWQRSTGGRTDIRAGVRGLEWVLITLLLINGMLAYAITVAREPSQHGDAGDGTGHGRCVEREQHLDVRALALLIFKRLRLGHEISRLMKPS